MIDKKTDRWRALPLYLKCWFWFNFLAARPQRYAARRAIIASHAMGYLCCLAGLASPPALAGGLILLANAYLFHFLTWQGDKYGIWFEPA